VKILCISDNTDQLIYSRNAGERYKDVDFVISAGDLPLTYYDYIATVLKKDIFWVYGNHNLEEFERNMHITRACADASSMRELVAEEFTLPIFSGSFCDGKVIHDREHDIIIAGLGGSFLYNKGMSQYTENQMRLRIARMTPRLIANKQRYGRYCDILLTHAAPYGIGDGKDLCHRGFESFLSFMDMFSPKYLLHGHVHLYDENAPRIRTYKNTTVINVYKNFLLDDVSL